MKKIYLILMVIPLLVSCGGDDVVEEQEEKEESKSIIISGHEAIDLGLPSGTLWASCNMGAESPKDHGYYYSWGETSTKATYTKSNYSLYYNGKNNYPSYNISGKSIDAAYANWGSKWSMPTTDQFIELNNKCTWEWCSMGSITTFDNCEASGRGYKITGPNGNSIFLPAAGGIWGTMMPDMPDEETITGYYWSGSLYENYVGTRSPACLIFSSTSIESETHFAGYSGLSIRPVTKK